MAQQYHRQEACESDMFTTTELENFVRESNKIEGILREPTPEEVSGTEALLELERVDIFSLVSLVGIYQPGARLRDSVGLDVRIGNHTPPVGGQFVWNSLKTLLDNMAWDAVHWTPYKVHIDYETLHPFTDGNGRSGRALWAWQMLHFDIWPELELGFLHAFYYQTLEASKI